MPAAAVSAAVPRLSTAGANPIAIVSRARSRRRNRRRGCRQEFAGIRSLLCMVPYSRSQAVSRYLIVGQDQSSSRERCRDNRFAEKRRAA